jgi:hypothetical protein
MGFLTQATNRAEIEGLGFTEIVERALEAYVKRKPKAPRLPPYLMIACTVISAVME